MSGKRVLRQRELVQDTNYPGKRVKRAITISCERQNGFDLLDTAGRKAKKNSANSAMRLENRNALGKSGNLFLYIKLNNITNYIHVYICDILEAQMNHCSKDTLDMILKENTRLTKANGKLAEEIIEKDHKVIELLQKKIDDQANIHDLTRKVQQKNDEIQQLKNELAAFKHAQFNGNLIDLN